MADQSGNAKKEVKASAKSNDFEHVMGALLNGANGVISGKTVVGEPIIVGDTTLIPLNDVFIGAGGGSNGGPDKNAGMGGFTAKMSPSAVLILKNGVTKVVNIRNQDSISKLVDMVPEVIERILEQTTVQSMMSDEEALQEAFPDDGKGEGGKTKETDSSKNEQEA